jgi:predicted RNA-binding protein with PUA-like domain
MKSEPDVFGIDDLRAARGKRTCWDGVRNYQARNFMRKMKVGDRIFFYHSNCAEPGIVGIAKVAKEAYADQTAFDPKDAHFDPKSNRERPTWFMVDVLFERNLSRTITLLELRSQAQSALDGLLLLRRGNRLSVMPVAEEHWHFILSLE